MEDKKSWVETWGIAHMALSLMSFVSRKRTLRLVLNSGISGEKARIRLCNKYSSGAVEIGCANIASCDKDGNINDMESLRQLSFKGRKGVTLEPGETIISDETDFGIPPNSYICVNIYIRSGKLKSGNCLNDTLLICAKGNMSQSPHIKHKKRPRDYIIALAYKILGSSTGTPIPLFQSVELLNVDGAESIVCFGDSLTQQGFWTSAFEKNIRRLYPGRYSVINKGISGNRVLRDTSKTLPLKGFFGIKALERVHDDVFAYEGIGRLILCIGINDLLQPGTISASKKEEVPASDIASGVKKLVSMIREHDIRLVGLNYIPIGSSKDATAKKSEILHEMNEWFETCGLFEHLFDVYSAFASPENPDLPNPAYVGKDKTHPNVHGGQAIANSIDYEIFK